MTYYPDSGSKAEAPLTVCRVWSSGGRIPLATTLPTGHSNRHSLVTPNTVMADCITAGIKAAAMAIAVRGIDLLTFDCQRKECIDLHVIGKRQTRYSPLTY